MRSLKKINKAGKNIIGIIAAVALITIGVIFTIATINMFQQGIEKTQDRQLKKTASTVDYNMSESIKRFDVQMGVFVNSNRFGNALDKWILYGDSYNLDRLTEGSSLSNLNSYDNLFVENQAGERIYAIDGFEYEIKDNIKDNIYRCRTSSGAEGLAVKYQLKKDISCYGIIDVESSFYSILRRMKISEENVLLIEGKTGELFYEDEGHIDSCPKGKYSTAGKLNEIESEILAKNNKNGTVSADGYTETVKKNSNEKKVDVRIVTIPVSVSENGVFAVSASEDYNSINSLLGRTATKLILSLIAILLGIGLFILILIEGNKERKEVDHELELLKEKNRQMEDLNKKTQELAHHQRLETIGTMTSSIAHEFNNLLTPIMGYSMMTLEKLPQDDEVIYDDILEIYNASVKAKEIISRLSELSRKNTEHVFKRLNPDALVNKVLKVVAPVLPTRVDIIRDMHCRDEEIEGNEVQLSQLLINLIINAFHAIEDDAETGEITVITRREGDFILFAIQDNGGGISEDIKDKIFDPFFTTKESGAGTGLGLAIAMQAAEDHGGRIELESEEGEGTTFRVYIPGVEKE